LITYEDALPCDRADRTIQAVLPTVYKIHNSRLILTGNRPEGLMRNIEEKEDEDVFR
jgi:hypothetical protein